LKRPSRTFLCILFGFVLTIAGRVGPWHWPVWPAASLLDLYLSRAQPSVVSGNMKAVGLVVLLVINVGFWAAISATVVALIEAARRHR
jgi:hypothetical protein